LEYNSNQTASFFISIALKEKKKASKKEKKVIRVSGEG
jgi:hypothetical protein